jgi:hypothetical protein
MATKKTTKHATETTNETNQVAEAVTMSTETALEALIRISARDLIEGITFRVPKKGQRPASDFLTVKAVAYVKGKVIADIGEDEPIVLSPKLKVQVKGT